MAMIPMEYGGGTWTEITKSGLGAGSQVKYKKDESLVCLHVDIRDMTSQNAWVEVGTIPLDACPATSAFSATTMYFTGISSGTSGISAGYINLNKSTGVIYVWTTQVQVHADITYMI